MEAPVRLTAAGYFDMRYHHCEKRESEVIRWLRAVQDMAKSKSGRRNFPIWASLTAVPSSLHYTDSVHVPGWSPCGRDGELSEPATNRLPVYTATRSARVRKLAMVRACLSAGRVRSAVLGGHFVRFHLVFFSLLYSSMSL